jgi:hypothetical protein
MAVMTGVVGALSAFYHDAMDFSDAEHRNVSFNRLVAKLPTIVAMAYKYNTGAAVHVPGQLLDYTANFMRMMFGNPCEKYKPNPVLVRALDTIFTLHADHEQNASTSTVRLAGSSGANPFACIAAGIACLWGPAHGGANEACLQMLEEIGDVSRVPNTCPRQGQERFLQADGLRSPCLQELRPARQADAPGLQRRAEPNSVWKTTACSSWRWNWKRSRWKIRTSSRRSSTRTSTSTPASCRRRSAFRPKCSPASSRWPVRWAG